MRFSQFQRRNFSHKDKSKTNQELYLKYQPPFPNMKLQIDSVWYAEYYISVQPSVVYHSRENTEEARLSAVCCVYFQGFEVSDAWCRETLQVALLSRGLGIWRKEYTVAFPNKATFFDKRIKMWKSPVCSKSLHKFPNFSKEKKSFQCLVLYIYLETLG